MNIIMEIFYKGIKVYYIESDKAWSEHAIKLICVNKDFKVIVKNEVDK